ncbi:MAG: hypothetical protein GTN93_03615 [Anaerolineae bacterium]|nr:hypothetical protein [Anaerolineae bacterium]
MADLQIPAIEAAGKLKDERTIKPIVQRLGEDCSMSVFDGKSEEEMAKSREAKIQALKQITGQDFGHAYYRWIAYAEYTT